MNKKPIVSAFIVWVVFLSCMSLLYMLVSPFGTTAALAMVFVGVIGLGFLFTYDAFKLHSIIKNANTKP